MENPTTQPFVRLPLRLLQLQSQKLLSPVDLVVYGWALALIRERARSWKAKTSDVPISDIARSAGIDRRTVAFSLQRLQEYGFLHSTHGNGHRGRISIGAEMSTERALNEHSVPIDPLIEERSSIEDREYARASAQAALAPLRSLVLGVIRLNPTRTQHELRELAENRFLESSLEHTITEFQTVWESINWDSLD